MGDGANRDDGPSAPATVPTSRPRQSWRSGWSAASTAGVASLGAGAVHAAAVGWHAEEPTLARLFVAVAAAQLAVGLALLVRGGRGVAALAAVVNGAAVAGWAVSRLAGIAWISGLERAERAGFADTACAALGAVAAGGAVLALLAGRTTPRPATRLAVPATAVGLVTVIAMVVATTGNHEHAEAGASDHEHTETSGEAVAAEASDHAHGDSGTPGDPSSLDGDVNEHTRAEEAAAPEAAVGATGGSEPGQPTTVAPRPYDPTQPIDLSGVDGVTPEQQAFAENLVAATVVGLPQWSDPAVAEAAGFHSIGDAGTGHEHYINWSWIDDDVWLDPDAPESLVYEPQPDGTKRLVAAMYMLPHSMTLADVPDWGGQLMQWHIHNDLCFTDDPVAPRVAGVTSPGGACQLPLVRLGESPMIHVWITSTPCGPFAALEGIGGGAIQAGETRWCDHVHGS